MDIQAEKEKRREALQKRKQEKYLREAGLSRNKAKYAVSEIKRLRDAEEAFGREDRISETDVDSLLKKLKILK